MCISTSGISNLSALPRGNPRPTRSRSFHGENVRASEELVFYATSDPTIGSFLRIACQRANICIARLSNGTFDSRFQDYLEFPLRYERAHVCIVCTNRQFKELRWITRVPDRSPRFLSFRSLTMCVFRFIRFIFSPVDPTQASNLRRLEEAWGFVHLFGTGGSGLKRLRTPLGSSGRTTIAVLDCIKSGLIYRAVQRMCHHLTELIT